MPDPAHNAVRRESTTLFGLPFDTVTLAQTVAIVRHACQTRTRLYLTTVNVNFVVAAQKDEAFRQSILDSDLCVADGKPIVWASRMFGSPLPERVAGADLFDALRHHAAPSISVYFFGGLAEVAKRASEVLNAEAGGVRCVGFESPGFGTVEAMSTQAHLDRINAARPDFVVVALGAQKGQAWIAMNRVRLDAPVISYLGAVVNFVAGTVARAPAWVCSLGLEWLWRIAQEPGLWRRYTRDGIQFALLVLNERARRTKAR